MASISIPCPKCESKLKLKDGSLLGKTGKCPKCQHRFVLQQQVEVAMKLVEEAAEPETGLHPQWIPDAKPATPTAKKTKSPQQVSPKTVAAASPVAPAKVDNPLSFLNEEKFSTSEPLVSTNMDEDAPPVIMKRRKKSNTTILLFTFFTLFVAVAGAGYLYMAGNQGKKKSKDLPAGLIAQNNGSAEKPNAPEQYERFNSASAKNPTSGKPIQLYNMPAGVRIAINIRPNKLWSDERQLAVFRGSLGPLGSWLEEEIQKLSKQQDLALIDEMLIGIILGPMGTEPELAAVIHFTEEQKRSALLTTYDGTAVNEFSTDLKISNGRAYRIINNKTVAICPEKYLDDMLLFEKTPALTADNIQEILKATDRDRLVTVAFDPADIEQHLEMLLPETAKMVTQKTLRWLGDNVWAAAWSLHLEDDFYAELVVRGRNEVGPTALSRRYSKRLQTLPEMLLTAVQKMEPQRSGSRQIIGRFPAMMKVVAMTTAVAVDGRFVRMATLLPPKAGPNLALGTLLAWDESTRTDFSDQVVVKNPATNKPDISKLPILKRMERKIDVDFRRTPLQEAFAYIAEESKINIELDGDALKLAGFTKNMPQTFKLDQVTVREAIYGIIKRYEAEKIPIVIHVSIKENKIIVLTKTVAEDRKLEIFTFNKTVTPEK